MRRYGRIQGLLLSLGWADFYRDVAKNWHGIGLLYVLLVIVLTWIPILVKMQLYLGQQVREELPKHLADIPDITLKGGKVSSPVAQPCVVFADDNGNPIVILDTTGQTDFEKTKAMFLITETKLFQRDPNRTQITDLSAMPDFTLSRDTVLSWATTGANWSAITCFPFCVIGSLIGWLVVMLIAAAIGMAANGKSRLPFGTVLRLAGVGTTLGQYFTTAAMFFSIVVPFQFWICVAITAAYAIFGVKCAERDRLDDAMDDFDHREDPPDDRRAERRPPPPASGGPSDAFRSGPTGP
jgi:Protein of unknown function (DUF1189)